MKSIKFFIFCSLLSTLLFPNIALGQSKIETQDVYSAKMKCNIKNLVVLPNGYSKSTTRRYPVLYLLHGHGGDYNTWHKRIKKNLPEEATKYGIIIVCPDGQNSWYWDSPIDPKVQFETYISKELVSFIDKKYKTIASPKGRAITGFSMGGHGGLWLGIRHPNIFGACGSISGGVDIRPFPASWDMSKRLGVYAQNKAIWNNHTVITQLDKIKPNTLAIIFDCGKDDFFFNVNEQLHKEMLRKNILHEYVVRPGAHTPQYCSNSFDYQLLFFWKFFYNTN